jgi:hypothetical protein
MRRFQFSDEERSLIAKERFYHPNPRVQRRMEILCHTGDSHLWYGDWESQPAFKGKLGVLFYPSSGPVIKMAVPRLAQHVRNLANPQPLTFRENTAFSTL